MNTRLSELGPCIQEPIAWLPFNQWTFPGSTTAWTFFYHMPSGYRLRFPGTADFDISAEGDEITARPVPGTSPATVEHLFLNQVLPLALSRQGQLVLHASAVEIEGVGVAFMGVSGRGKSTMAASFATSGFRFLTDDGLILSWDSDQCVIKPSHPSIRLWEDSQEALCHEEMTLAPAVDFTTKSRLLAGGSLGFCDEPRVLHRAYFLGNDNVSSVKIRTVKPAQALMELVAHTFLLDVHEQNRLTWHFEALTRMVALPIYYRLDYPRHYDYLPQVRDAIIQHAMTTIITEESPAQ